MLNVIQNNNNKSPTPTDDRTAAASVYNYFRINRSPLKLHKDNFFFEQEKWNIHEDEYNNNIL